MDEPRYETIRPRTRLLGRRLIHLATTPSTMDEARRLAHEGAHSGTVIVADVQTAGRGRAERAWHSPPGSLLATILIRDEVPLHGLPLLSLASGIAIINAIQKLTRVEARLKWPNDVWIGAKKAAGVLLETRIHATKAEHVLIGLGVNGNIRPDEFPTELRSAATSLSIEAQRHVCLPALLKLILEDVDRTIVQLQQGDSKPILQQIRAKSLVLGRRVRVDTPQGPAEGLATEIGDQGELIVETQDGRRAVNVGDCQLLRAVD
jgi:BirA family transcriptional regulator, biotin operon repressor / biotin---[acetyl-CoA-carboxylase] ligase